MRSAILFAAAILMLASGARAAEPQPGWWEVKVKIAAASGPHEQVSTSCLTPEQTRNIASGFDIPQSPGITCTRANNKWDGTTLSFQIRCDIRGNKSEGEVRYVFDTPTHYTATMKNTISMRGQSIVSSTTMEGRRVGECPAQTKK